jgi:anti-sigma B factor antagonist
MDIGAEQVEGALVLTPRIRRLDAAAAPEFRTQALSLIAGHSVVVLDLKELTFIDSSGLGVLVSLLKSIPPGGRLRLAHAAANVKKLLEMTRLQAVLPSFGSVQDAVHA